MDTQNQGAAIPRKKSNRGILFVIPMLTVVFIVLILPFIVSIYLALTNYNAPETPNLAGLNNYVNLFKKDTIFQTALNNTFRITFLSVLIISMLSFFSSYLIRPAHKATKYSVLLLFNLISFFTIAGGYNILFSSDLFGFITSRLSKSDIKGLEILFLLDTYITLLLQLLIICLVFFGPILTVLCLTKTLSVPENKILRILLPLENSLHVYLAVWLPILLVPFCRDTLISFFGFPSTGYAAHTIVNNITDYSNLRLEAGYISPLSIILFLINCVFLLTLFALICGAMNVIAYIKRKIFNNLSVLKTVKFKKTTVYITIGLLLLCALLLLLPLFIVFLNSFKSSTDLLTIPSKIFPSKLSLQSYKDLFTIDNSYFPKRFVNMLVLPLLPALTSALVTGISAYGISAFDFKARRPLYVIILLSLILLPTTALSSAANPSLSSHLLFLSFYAVFFSAAPLIGFVYLKSVIDHALHYGQNLVFTVAKNCIPVILITYVMCFISPFDSSYSLSSTGFLRYFFHTQANDTVLTDTDSASIVILVGVTFAFLVLSAVTATAFFPRERTKLPPPSGRHPLY